MSTGDTLALARLTAERLNTASMALNESLLRVEKSLVDLRFGVEASAPMPDGLRLVFGRTGRGWGLLVMDGDKERHLAECSRLVRAAAARALPELIADLVAAADAAHADVLRGIAAADVALAGLGASDLGVAAVEVA
jgi:hypothetical protein